MLLAPLIVFLVVPLGSVAIILEEGNSPISGTHSLDTASVPGLAVLMLDFQLTNGGLREYRVTTSTFPTPTRLQIWRPVNETNNQFELGQSTRFVPTVSGNYSILPSSRFHIQNGDRLGFYSEATPMGISYDFVPMERGTDMVIKSFHQESSHPTTGDVINFEKDVYRVWRFGLSVMIDTEYGEGPLPDFKPMPDVGPPHVTTPFPQTVSPVIPPTSIPGEVIVGNQITDGNVMQLASGDNFILTEKVSPEGHVTNFHLFSAASNRKVLLQIWRPLTPGNFKLIHQIEHETSKVKLRTPVAISKGDVIGFFNLNNESAIKHQHDSGSPGAQTVYAKREAIPVTGNSYYFPNRFSTYRFSISATVRPSNITGPVVGESGKRCAINKYMPLMFSIPQGPRTYYWWWYWLLIIPVLMAIIAIVSSIYALCVHCDKKATFYVNSDDTPKIEAANSHWILPKENIYLYEPFHETHTNIFYRAEITSIDFAGKNGIGHVAVKTTKDVTNDHEKICLSQELELMTSLLPHPNVLQLFGYCRDAESPLLVMEYPVYGSLIDYLRDLRKSYTHVTIAGHSNYSLTHELMSFATQIARGMSYLSSLKILHRDLAARNILLGEGKFCKITCFGEAQNIIDTHHYDKVCQARQPIRWMPPESLFREDFSPKSDIWSFGILIWEIVTLGATPYSNLQMSQVMKHIKNGHVLVSPPHCKPQLFSVMCKCWLIKATTRPNFDLLAEILQALHEESADLIQLEKYPSSEYFILDSDRPDEIV